MWPHCRHTIHRKYRTRSSHRRQAGRRERCDAQIRWNVALMSTHVRAAHRTFDMCTQSFQALSTIESETCRSHQPYAAEPATVRDSSSHCSPSSCICRWTDTCMPRIFIRSRLRFLLVGCHHVIEQIGPSYDSYPAICEGTGKDPCTWLLSLWSFSMLEEQLVIQYIHYHLLRRLWLTGISLQQDCMPV
jgi:hypothetical protein